MAAELVGTRSISEQVGVHLDDRFQTRVMFGSWVLPAAGLVATGILGMGSPSGATSIVAQLDPAEAVARVQAAVLILAVITVLVTVRCAVLRLPAAPVKASSRIRMPLFVGCLGLGVLAATEARIAVTTRPVLIPVAALAGLAAAIVAALWMFRLPGVQAGPIIGLATVIAGQLTIGWLPILEPELASSPVPILMGLLLAVAAVGAARAEPFAPAIPVVRTSHDTVVLDLSNRDADVEFALQPQGHTALPLG